WTNIATRPPRVKSGLWLPLVLRSILRLDWHHSGDSNAPVPAKMPIKHHANETQSPHVVPEPVAHARFALPAGRQDGQNTVFDWYGPHDSEQHGSLIFPKVLNKFWLL